LLIQIGGKHLNSETAIDYVLFNIINYNIVELNRKVLFAQKL